MTKKRNLKLEFNEKIEKKDKTKIVVWDQKEIDLLNKSVGERIARMKRYGRSATQRKKN